MSATLHELSTYPMHRVPEAEASRTL